MEITKEKILVTGALGQIGTELTSKLVEIYGKENVVASGIEKSVGAERDVIVGVASDVEPERIGEYFFVSIGRRIEQ